MAEPKNDEQVRIGELLFSMKATSFRWSRDRKPADGRQLADAFGRIVTALEAERDRLAEQVQRVRDVHRPVSAHVGDPDDDDTLTTVCVHCEVLYPCDTIRALDKTGAGS